MTFNELKEEFKGYRLKTTENGWEKIKESKGNCIVYDYNYDDEDKEVYFDVF